MKNQKFQTSPYFSWLTVNSTLSMLFRICYEMLGVLLGVWEYSGCFRWICQFEKELMGTECVMSRGRETKESEFGDEAAKHRLGDQTSSSIGFR